MWKIGLHQAKTNLCAIARRVKQSGQPITLTRYGKPIVDLVPHLDSLSRRSQRHVLSDLDKLRCQLRRSTFRRIKADISHGRHSFRETDFQIQLATANSSRVTDASTRRRIPNKNSSTRSAP